MRSGASMSPCQCVAGEKGGNQDAAGDGLDSHGGLSAKRVATCVRVMMAGEGDKLHGLVE